MIPTRYIREGFKTFTGIKFILFVLVIIGYYGGWWLNDFTNVTILVLWSNLFLCLAIIALCIAFIFDKKELKKNPFWVKPVFMIGVLVFVFFSIPYVLDLIIYKPIEVEGKITYLTFKSLISEGRLRSFYRITLDYDYIKSYKVAPGFFSFTNLTFGESYRFKILPKTKYIVKAEKIDLEDFKTYPEPLNLPLENISEINKENLDGNYNVEGYVVSISPCFERYDPLTPGLRELGGKKFCEGILASKIIISNNKHVDPNSLHTLDLSENELVIFVNETREFDLRKKYRFSIRISKAQHYLKRDTQLLGYELIE